ncbi:hypothetical protein INT47_009661 [Mucor saturninus]|uniref:Aladin seven-bladed propeller domain-containing protein n=1 Tax=Mucor saturninus TaxID=64648 RepID=A0A8H7QS31_9FUNG|nr:hypothetical protein INT47_009661 [Mucor saturninus]
MQEVASSTPLYPSIPFEPVDSVAADYAYTPPVSSGFFETTRSSVVKFCTESWEQRRPAIEATPAYQKAKDIYSYVHDNYLKTPEMIFEHPLFNNESSIQCMAWHPHLEILAVAHKDNNVYVYEKKDGAPWACQVLSHEKMERITCISWKKRASGTLAVGCQEGVCVWTIQRTDYSDSKPKYHPKAMMRYLQLTGQSYISSLAWDPTPASQLLAVVSAVTNTVVVYDMLLDRAIPLKRYGKGNILLRWSPNGEWLFEGGSAGLSRMWDTSDWSSQQIKNPPGLWIQAACWSPDNQTLVYSMCGKCDVHVLILSGKTIKQSIKEEKALSTPLSTAETASGISVPVGGVIRDMTLDERSGMRLAIAYEKSPLIGLYSINNGSPFDLQKNPMFFPM